MSDFEKKLEKECDEQCFDMPPVVRPYFMYGAHWSRTETANEVFEAVLKHLGDLKGGSEPREWLMRDKEEILRGLK